jgi:hypothetical protein
MAATATNSKMTNQGSHLEKFSLIIDLLSPFAEVTH